MHIVIKLEIASCPCILEGHYEKLTHWCDPRDGKCCIWVVENHNFGFNWWHKSSHSRRPRLIVCGCSDRLLGTLLLEHSLASMLRTNYCITEDHEYAQTRNDRCRGGIGPLVYCPLPNPCSNSHWHGSHLDNLHDPINSFLIHHDLLNHSSHIYPSIIIRD